MIRKWLTGLVAAMLLTGCGPQEPLDVGGLGVPVDVVFGVECFDGDTPRPQTPVEGEGDPCSGLQPAAVPQPTGGIGCCTCAPW